MRRVFTHAAHAARAYLEKRHGIPHGGMTEEEHLNDLAEHFHTMMPLDPAGPPYKPSCGSSRQVGSDYDLKLHLASFVVLLVTSSVAAYTPIYMRHLIKKQRIAVEERARLQVEDGGSMLTGTKEKMAEIASNTFHWALWATKHFGTGIIIGTAFIHVGLSLCCIVGSSDQL